MTQYRVVHVLTACWSPAGVYLQINKKRVANHGFVARGDIDIHTNNSLLCVTPNNTNCCSSAETEGDPLGNWYFPNGTEVPTNDTGWPFYITRGPGVVRLHRHTGGVSGIYRCVIPDQSGVNQTLYVGLYAVSDIKSGKQNNLMHDLCCSISDSCNQFLVLGMFTHLHIAHMPVHLLCT